MRFVGIPPPHLLASTWGSSRLRCGADSDLVRGFCRCPGRHFGTKGLRRGPRGDADVHYLQDLDLRFVVGLCVRGRPARRVLRALGDGVAAVLDHGRYPDQGPAEQPRRADRADRVQYLNI